MSYGKYRGCATCWSDAKRYVHEKEEEGANTIDENNRIAKKCSSELLKKAEHAIEQFERTHGEDVSIVTETDTNDDSLVIKIFGRKK